ncbi:MAG TPA: YdeI/OmpD-associated family protein [Solirubrobacteraceae bacterium]|nr:YdeI/OmpD-associated family protein [Solirubrobacteraceae bacterium]
MGQRTAATELPLVEFVNRLAWEAWLAENHDGSAGVWLKLAKKGAPRETVTQAEATEAALCFGWIDGQVGALDDHFYRQRFTHRRPQSKWSQINRRRATELIASGLMRPPGFEEVKKAKADGRWDAAYEPQATATVPPDFAQALAANPEAEAFFNTLTGVRRYAFLYRISDAKRPETRARRIEKFVEVLARRETLN